MRDTLPTRTLVAAEPRPWTARRLARLSAIGLAVALVLIQFIPYGHNHTNPPVVQEPNWDSPRTRALAIRACYDCHSNQTDWRWYSHVAPASWLIQSDVEGGRWRLNFSEANRSYRGAEPNQLDRALGQNANMPPWYYLPLHPSATLTAQERQELLAGLRATYK